MVRERMSSVDTAWLRMDSVRNRMVIVGLVVFRTPVALDALREVLGQRLLHYDRFRQKVVADATGYHWVEDPAFRLDRHLKTVRLRRGDDAELQQFAARMAVRGFDRRHPLWQMHLVENYRGSNALLVRIHHCIADGIALVRVMLSLGEGADTPMPAAHGTDADADGSDEGAALETNPWLPYLQPLAQGARSAIDVTGSALALVLDAVSRPERLAGHAHVGARVVTDALDLLLMADDTPTHLKGVPGGSKALAWNEPLPLDEVKAVCRALGASVNDVLLACVTGALRRYLIGRGDAPGADSELRAMVPVNLRPLTGTPQLGNRFGLVPLCLPVGIASPVERVREVRRRMDELKGGYQPVLAYALLAVCGVLPQPLQQQVLGYLGNKGTAVMTNVPGPREPIRMAGAEMSRVMVWVPQSGDIGLGVAILSYMGGVQFGVIADTALCPDPQRIIDGFAPEFERLVLALAMLPNGMLIDHDLAEGELEHLLLLEPA